MSINDILLIIKNISYIMVYIVPGCIAFFIGDFIICAEGKHDNFYILKSIIFSYVMVNIVKLFIHTETSAPIFFIVCVILSVVFAFVFATIITSDKFKSVLKKMSIDRTYSIDVWDDIKSLLNKDEGFWLTVYLEKEKIIYQGIPRKFQEQIGSMDYYVFLKNYSSYSYEGNELSDYSSDSSKWVAIKANEISRIEIQFDKDHS